MFTAEFAENAETNKDMDNITGASPWYALVMIPVPFRIRGRKRPPQEVQRKENTLRSLRTLR
jgi:hypothetical protein